MYPVSRAPSGNTSWNWVPVLVLLVLSVGLPAARGGDLNPTPGPGLTAAQAWYAMTAESV